MRKCRIGTAKFFTLLLLLYRTSVNAQGIYSIIPGRGNIFRTTTGKRLSFLFIISQRQTHGETFLRIYYPRSSLNIEEE
ncbi:hypothetical protein CXT88_00950 [Akkermansia muciniphila]|nr:hypothetical protein CXT88_00950 [Akkermansia muciniphila]